MSFSATMSSPEPASRFVECECCCASGPAFSILELGSDAEAKSHAVAAWNRRAPAQLDRVREEERVQPSDGASEAARLRGKVGGVAWQNEITHGLARTADWIAAAIRTPDRTNGGEA